MTNAPLSDIISYTPPTVTLINFVQRFTNAEWAALSASADAVVKQGLFILQTLNQVNLAGANVTSWLNYLVSIGLLTAARVTAIETL